MKSRVTVRKSYKFWKEMYSSMPDNIDYADRFTITLMVYALMDERKMFMYQQTATYYKESLDYFIKNGDIT